MSPLFASTRTGKEKCRRKKKKGFFSTLQFRFTCHFSPTSGEPFCARPQHPATTHKPWKNDAEPSATSLVRVTPAKKGFCFLFVRGSAKSLAATETGKEDQSLQDVQNNLPAATLGDLRRLTPSLPTSKFSPVHRTRGVFSRAPMDLYISLG